MSETGDISNNETDESPIDFSQVRSIESEVRSIESDVVQYEYVTGLRKNSKLLYSTNEKQLYFRKNTNKKHTVFVCNEKMCPAQLQCLLTENVQNPQSMGHTITATNIKNFYDWNQGKQWSARQQTSHIWRAQAIIWGIWAKYTAKI